MRFTHLALPFFSALVFSGSAAAFELKGISPGAGIDTVDRTACRALKNADSDMPGYSCATTFGGAPAVMELSVADQKIVSIQVSVERQVMGSVLNALEEKYGKSSKPNRYIEDYRWKSGAKRLSIEEDRISSGYIVFAADMSLYLAFTNKKKETAKGDL